MSRRAMIEAEDGAQTGLGLDTSPPSSPGSCGPESENDPTGDDASSSMVDMPFSPDVKMGIEELCPVCGDKVSGYHYGLQTCESCKGFFKRTVQNKKVYSCVDNRSCHIDKTQRKRCPYCRFQKCLNVGMKLEAVRTDRMRGGRNKFGPMYKRDRALKQQAIRQRQHMITQCQMSLNNLPPGLQTMDGSQDIKPNIAVLMSGPLSPVMPHAGGVMHGSMLAPPGSSSPESPLTTDGSLSISMSVSMTASMAPESMPASQGSYYPSSQNSYSMVPMVPGMAQSRHQEQQEQQQQQQQHQQQQNDCQQPHHSHHHHHHQHHSQHLQQQQQHQQHHSHHQYQQQLQQQQHHSHPHHPQSHHQQQQQHHHSMHPLHTTDHTQQHQPHPHSPHRVHPPLSGGPTAPLTILTPEVPAVIKNLRASLGHEEDRRKKLLMIFDEQVTMLQQQQLLLLGGQQQEDSAAGGDSSSLQCGLSGAVRDLLQVLCKICDQSLFLLVEWARGACFFKDLRVEDQMKLLQNCWSELLILDFVHTQMKHDKQDQILLASGHMVSIELLNRAGLLECRDRLQDLVRKFRELEADENEFVCLKFLILLNPDVCGLLNRHHVEQIQEKINSALLEYCTSLQPHMADRFGQLLVRLPEIRLMSLRIEEYLYFRHLYGDVQEQSLLVEMLHAKRK